MIAQGKAEASRRSHTPIPLEACLPIVPSEHLMPHGDTPSDCYWTTGVQNLLAT